MPLPEKLALQPGAPITAEVIGVVNAALAWRYGERRRAADPSDLAEVALLAAVDDLDARDPLAHLGGSRGDEFRRAWRTLTPREAQVARGLLDCRRPRDIAAELEISWKTVATHRGNLLAKLGVAGVPEMLRAAVAAGVERL